MFKKQQAALGRLNGYIEMIDGLKVVEAFTYETRSKEVCQAERRLPGNAMLANFLGQIVRRFWR